MRNREIDDLLAEAEGVVSKEKDKDLIDDEDDLQ